MYYACLLENYIYWLGLSSMKDLFIVLGSTAVEGIDRNLMAYKFKKWEKLPGLFVGRKEPHQSWVFLCCLRFHIES